jgi:hypothetical protein
MSTETVRERAGLIYLIGVVGAFLIVAALVWAMRHYNQPAGLNTKRMAERAQALVELRAAEAEAVAHVAWIDQSKGLVRLPVDQAMKLVLQEWQNPAAGRSNLLARVAKANPPPPPKAPEKPSPFE